MIICLFNPSDQGAQDPDVLHGSVGGEQAESGPNPQVCFNIRIFQHSHFSGIQISQAISQLLRSWSDNSTGPMDETTEEAEVLETIKLLLLTINED